METFTSEEQSVRKRDFLLLAAGITTWPFPVFAQVKPVRIGFVFFGTSSNTYDKSLVDVFRVGLREVGLIEEKDILLDVIWINGDPELAVKEALTRGADILVSSGTSTSVAANAMAGTTPVVFISVGNPLGMGLVQSLARPGRNVTGFSDQLADIAGKLVEIAAELSSADSTVIDYLWYTPWPDGYNRFEATQLAAQKARLDLRSRTIVNIEGVDDAVAGVKKDGARIVIVQPSPFTYTNRQRVIDIGFKHGVGTIFAFPVAATEGALVGYGPDYLEMYRKAPTYIARIIKGTSPAELPVEQPTKIQMILNIRTAKALGADLPLSLLLRANELIE